MFIQVKIMFSVSVIPVAATESMYVAFATSCDKPLHSSTAEKVVGFVGPDPAPREPFLMSYPALQQEETVNSSSLFTSSISLWISVKSFSLMG